MTKKLIEICLIGVLFLFSYPASCDANNYSEIEGNIKKGQSRQTIIELLGEPLLKNIFVKRNKSIWGPEEEFWDDIPLETLLEVWKYEFPDGYLTLYFINKGDYLDYKAFAPKGVIY